MLAVSRRRAEGEYLPHALVLRDLTPNDVDLTFEAAKGRDDLEPDSVLAGRGLHRLPRPGGGGRQSMPAAPRADLDHDQFLRFGAERQLPSPDDGGGGAEPRGRGIRARLQSRRQPAP